MHVTPSLLFFIQQPDGTTRELCVDAESATVGSGAHCEIRLSDDDVSLDQLHVEARDGNVFAEARSMSPPVLWNGLAFTRGRLLPSSVLQVGSCRLRVQCAQSGGGVQAARAPAPRTRPVVWALGALGLPLGLFLALRPLPNASALGAPPEPPPLWADAPQPCGAPEPASARAQAWRHQEQASAHRERAPFAPQDGVAAAALYASAARCFADAGDADEAEAAEAEAATLRERTARSFHVHQVRLERALAVGDHEAARTETRLLRAFVGTRGPVYGSWLSALERRIDVALAKREAKKR